MSTTNTNTVSSTGSTLTPIDNASERSNPTTQVGLLKVRLCPRCEMPMKAYHQGAGEYFHNCTACDSVRDPFEEDEIELAQTVREKSFIDRLFSFAV